MLRVQKSAQRWRVHHFHSPYGPETSQGVTLDSLGVSVIEIGCIGAPDRWQRRQEAPKRCLATPAWLLCFLAIFSQQRGC